MSKPHKHFFFSPKNQPFLPNHCNFGEYNSFEKHILLLISYYASKGSNSMKGLNLDKVPELEVYR